MKLAEALQVRADLQRRIAQMPQRLRNNATVQEGSEPTEQPSVILGELDRMLVELESLVTRINLTNCAIATPEGETMTALISRRDILRKRLEIMRGFLNAAGDITPRHSLSEIRVLSTVNVPELRSHCDRLSKELRETDTKIQELNWTSELI